MFVSNISSSRVLIFTWYWLGNMVLCVAMNVAFLRNVNTSTKK